jgi:hypothetical protein
MSLVAPISALATSVQEPPARSGTGDNCVVLLEHVTPSGPEARIVSETCFVTFSDAIRHATGGKTILPADARPGDFTQEMLPEGPTSTVVLGIDYDAFHYDETAGARIWEASSSCTPSLSWTVWNVGNDWNDRISSAKSYGGCHYFEHWENYYWDGAVRTCTPNCYYIGDAMNDRTSSLRWNY